MSEKSSLWAEVARGSYILSRAVHWWDRVEVRPRLRIPVPRAFTYRDP